MTEGEWIGDRWSMMLSLKKNLRRNEENVSLSFSIRRRKKRPREREDEEKQKLSSLLETNQLDFFLLSLSLLRARLSSLRILSFSASQQQQKREGESARLDPSYRKELPLSILSTFILHFLFLFFSKHCHQHPFNAFFLSTTTPSQAGLVPCRRHLRSDSIQSSMPIECCLLSLSFFSS